MSNNNLMLLFDKSLPLHLLNIFVSNFPNGHIYYYNTNQNGVNFVFAETLTKQTNMKALISFLKSIEKYVYSPK